MKSRYISFVVILTLSACAAQDKPRVFMAGKGTVNGMTKGAAGGTGSRSGWWAAGRSDSVVDAHDESMELAKDFAKECPEAQVTVNQDAADYVTSLNRESKSKKGLFSKNDQVLVSNKAGDVLLSSAVRSVSTAAKDACRVIIADFAEHGHVKSTSASQLGMVDAAVTSHPSAVEQNGVPTELDVTSTPDGAEISVDGRFAGNTPSTINVVPGQHTIKVQMDGYQSWQREINTSGGKVRLSAILTKGKAHSQQSTNSEALR